MAASRTGNLAAVLPAEEQRSVVRKYLLAFGNVPRGEEDEGGDFRVEPFDHLCGLGHVDTFWVSRWHGVRKVPHSVFRVVVGQKDEVLGDCRSPLLLWQPEIY